MIAGGRGVGRVLRVEFRGFRFVPDENVDVLRGVADAASAFLILLGRIRTVGRGLNDAFANYADHDHVGAVDLRFVRKDDDRASVARLCDDGDLAKSFNFGTSQMNGEILSTLVVPHELIDFVRRRNKHGSDRAVDSDATVSDRDVDRLLFEKLSYRVSKFSFHVNIYFRYRSAPSGASASI